MANHIYIDCRYKMVELELVLENESVLFMSFFLRILGSNRTEDK